MSPEEWQRIKTIFDAAVELNDADRESFLATACGNDSDLMREVRSLLHALEDAGDFIESPVPSAELGGEAAFRRGLNIGPYQIVQVIGEGGMGMVYQAVRVDDLYRKLVALKVVRRGLFSEMATRKFETERHILAHLDHPNIAKLLDGGTTADGQPYFVMDFIAGTPIDEHCDNERLPLEQRLRLFLTVCSAVQYAHRNFIVHRDIKPQNILVTTDGSLRLLDFGIAKLLDPEADSAGESTSVVQMMTPEYASPEQLLNEPVTTASDTYSLGVLLYGMLTGHKPFLFKTRSIQEISAVIRDSEPRRPSVVVRLEESTPSGRALTVEGVAAARRLKPDKLARTLCGDLDNILLMALRREPERRYTSVEQLAADIERYLEGRPVSARDDTFSYRAAKFLRRHQSAVVAASLAVFLLIAGTITTAWEAHVATRERTRAERRFNDVRKVANSLLFDVHDAIRDLPGASPARQLIVTKALEFLDDLAPDSGDDRALQHELAAAYERLGDVQAQAHNIPGSVTGYRKALAIRQAMGAERNSDADAKREQIVNYAKLSDLLWVTDPRASLDYSARMLAVSESVATSSGVTLQDRVRLATSLLDYGYKESTVTDSGARGNYQRGLENCRRSIRLLGDLSLQEPLSERLLRLESAAFDRTAEVLEKNPAGRDEARQLRRNALTIRTRLASPANQHP